MADETILNITGLTKEYDRLRAVDHISFEVRPGEIVGLLGPNGAGKTTTINMILGVLSPTSGAIRVDGLDLARRRCEALQRTNFAAVYAPLPGNLTVEQNLRIFGMLYGVRPLAARSAGDLKRGGAAAAILLLLGMLLLALGAGTLKPGTLDPGLASGLLGAALLAFVMATLAGQFLSVSTLFTMDVFKAFSRNQDDTALVLVGRLVTTIEVIFAILAVFKAGGAYVPLDPDYPAERRALVPGLW